MAAPQQVQAAVDAGRRAGRGDDVAVVDIEYMRIDLHAWIALGQLARPLVMDGGGAAIEHAGGGQHEGAQAQADQLGAVGLGLAQRFQQRLGWRLVRVAPAGHDDDVGSRHVVQRVGRGDGEAGAGAQQAGRGGTHFDLEMLLACVAVIAAEYHAWHRQVKWPDAVICHHCDRLHELAFPVVSVSKRVYRQWQSCASGAGPAWPFWIENWPTVHCPRRRRAPTLAVPLKQLRSTAWLRQADRGHWW